MWQFDLFPHNINIKSCHFAIDPATLEQTFQIKYLKGLYILQKTEKKNGGKLTLLNSGT